MKALSGEQMVFLPGLDGTGISYEPLSQFIAPDADVTVVRYPADEALSFEETVECAAGQVSSTKGAVVVAESFSGPIAVELIGSGQLKPKCLVLCATFARSPWPLMLAIGRKLPLTAILGVSIPEALLRVVLGGAEFSAALLPMWHRVRSMVSPKVLAHRLKIVSRVDVRRWLPALTMPCCYIQAEGDVVAPPTAVLDFVAGVPEIELKSMRGRTFCCRRGPRNRQQ